MKLWLRGFAGAAFIGAGVCGFLLLAFNFHLSTAQTDISYILNILPMGWLIFSALLLPAALVITYIPAFITFVIADTWKIGSKFYFIISGGAVGGLTSPLLAYALSSFHGVYTDPPDAVFPDFSSEWLRAGPALIISGGAAGFVFWLLARFGRHEEAQKPQMV